MLSVTTRAIPWARSIARHTPPLIRTVSTKAAGASVEEVQCPAVIKETLEGLFSKGRTVKPHALEATLVRFRQASKTDPTVRRFVADVKELHGLYDTPYCVRSGPVSEDSKETFLNVVFAEMLSRIQGTEITCETFLKGRDASVESFHVDMGLQDLTRLKDVIMLSCKANPSGIPFEVLSVQQIKSQLSLEAVDKLMRTTCEIGSEVLMYSVPVLSKDEFGRDRLFVDQSLSLKSRLPHVNELFEGIDELAPKAIAVVLQPGDVVVMHNFSGAHRRGDKAEDGTPFKPEDYIAREMIRFDAVDPSQIGFLV